MTPKPMTARLLSGLRALEAAAAMSLAPSSAADARLVAEQLAIARAGSRSTTYLLPVGALLIAIAESPWVAPWRSVVWLGLLCASVAAGEIVNRRCERQTSTSPRAVAGRARIITATALVQAIVWCLMVPFLWPGDVNSGQTLLFLVVACTLSGWTSMGAVHFANGALAMLVYLVTLVAMPIVGGFELGMFLAALSAAFWCIMAALFNTNYRTREKMLRLADERGELVEKLQRAKDDSDRARHRAESASRAKSAFLANMSHELRTPLNAILGFSEIIQAGAAANEAQAREYAGYINGSGKHLLALIGDILDLAKIEAGRLALQETEVAIAPAIDAAVMLMSPRAQAGGLSVDVQIESGFPGLLADERAVRQIFDNLLSNAIKFTPPGGEVTVFARRGGDGAASFGVADTGVGIAQEDLPRVFESFGQGRHDAVVADRGTGLGLPIVRGLAEAMDGRVDLDSAPGRGTRVTVTLPVARVVDAPIKRAG